MHLPIYQVGFGPFVRNGKRKENMNGNLSKVALDKMKESKGKCPKQQVEEERDAAYSQMVQNVERTRAYGEEFNNQSLYYFCRRRTISLN